VQAAPTGAQQTDLWPVSSPLPHTLGAQHPMDGNAGLSQASRSAKQHSVPSHSVDPPAAVQSLPHDPQLLTLPVVLVHAPLQSTGAAAGQTHADPVQEAPIAQALPQLPQSWALVSVSTQDEPQSVLPPAQPHSPPVHSAAAGQALPQPPQLAGSVLVSAHRDPHRVTLLPQTHCPAWHSAPVPICWAQASSTAGSSSTMPSQSLSLPSQTSGE
jgi:hypothetical protein